MTNSLPWKITMLWSSVNHGKPSISIRAMFNFHFGLIHNFFPSPTARSSMVDPHMGHRPRWGEEAPWGRRSGAMAHSLTSEKSCEKDPTKRGNHRTKHRNFKGFLRNLYDWCLNWYMIDLWLISDWYLIGIWLIYDWYMIDELICYWYVWIGILWFIEVISIYDW